MPLGEGVHGFDFLHGRWRVTSHILVKRLAGCTDWEEFPGTATCRHYVNREATAQEVVSSIAADGGKAVAVRADVSKPSEVRRLFDEAITAFGHLDIVVANASVAIIKPVVECTRPK